MSINISLALIVAPSLEEAQRLDTALRSVAGVFDEICITITGTSPEVEKISKKHKAKISHIVWENDFAKARNYNFSQCTGDWIVWFDADDVIKGADAIRKNIELADANGVEGLAFLYHYAHDENGAVTEKHWKTQAIKNNNHAEWRGIIHEDIIPKRPANYASIKDVVRVHTAKPADSKNSLVRNLAILESAIEKEPEEPRHYFHLARCYIGLDQYQKVLEVVAKYLALSGWPEERADALNMAGEAYMRLGDLDMALQTFNDAVLQHEDAPDAYIYKARVYVQREEWLKALTCLEIASQRDTEASNLKRTALYDHDLYLLSAVCHLNTGSYKLAINAATVAHKNRGTEESKELVELAKSMLHDEELTTTFLRLGKNFLKEPEKVRALLSVVPEHIADDPRLLALRFSAEKLEWPKPSVVFYCGHTVESWDGNSVNTGGIGGSETAVVEISKRFVANGIPVTVYCRCDAEPSGTVVDGVTYKNYWQFNKEDTFDTLVLWRSPHLLSNALKARKKIVDMHDVSVPEVFTPAFLQRIDHIMVKSAYHRSLYPSVPDEKFIIIGNGIDLTRFSKTIPKERARFVYTSTPNRGLEVVLDVWSDIRKEVPDAELHVYYGWTTFYEIEKDNPVQMEWMRKMLGKMDQPGIINHGRVGQKELASDLLKSRLWLYPTDFPEIHCITALEMQAAGVYPITTGFAALAETQQSGVKLPGDTNDPEWRRRFVSEVIKAYKAPELAIESGKEYAERCSWDAVAADWLNYIR